MKQVVRRAARWALPVVVLVEAGLVLGGRLSLGEAVVVVVALEAALAVLVVGELAAGMAVYRTARANGLARSAALEQLVRSALPAPLARLVLAEARLYQSLALWLRGRRDGVGPGDHPLPYAGQSRALMLVMLGLSVAELVAVELLLPWRTLRLVLLVLGVWAVVFVLGLLAAETVRPHVLGADALRLRVGTSYDARVPLASVASVAPRLRAADKAWPYVEDGRLVVPDRWGHRGRAGAARARGAASGSGQRARGRGELRRRRHRGRRTTAPRAAARREPQQLTAGTSGTLPRCNDSPAAASTATRG